MLEKFKFPNPNNSGRGQSFCKNSECSNLNRCIFAFNSVLGGREMRLDFNACNLNCILCWSDNEFQDALRDTTQLFAEFLHCITQKDNYLKNKYPNGVNDEAAFRTSDLQVIGGEPFISNERFCFILDFLHALDQYIQNNPDAYRYLNLNRKNQFKIKIFTNGICIGDHSISEKNLLQLDMLQHLDIRILLSLKGLNRSATNQLQSIDNGDTLSTQVTALEKLLSLPLCNIKIEPVLGFYHSADFNIKTPKIRADKMFVFDKNDVVSMKLQQLLKTHVANKGKVFVEPVHSVPQSKRGKEEYFLRFQKYLELDLLIEPELKGGSRKDIKNTQLINFIKK